ncbi:hypothetical protein CRE_27024 [Caenorhabditis remanei]|uniref:G-protein coupled receptors family 1 profile domain-containing protein n=1 Tax=Caenorhabditis remanei TaxID=31234 RepID=E3LPU3_CAERE|nr:hypothetical protein CRE_27024 [Caenorhabditis remanei]
MKTCPYYFFDEREDSPPSLSCVYYYYFSNAVINCLEFEPYIALFSILINRIHLFILVQKPMRNSSINLIMAVTAFTDIISLIYSLEK